ncbi:MAG: multidrug efflux MFS transporter [Bdellovibrionales bacterium]|nr:multidrug efflux MFS transporter [Bdellovibrionales bacterium]
MSAVESVPERAISSTTLYARTRKKFDEKPPEDRRKWVLWTLMVGSLIAGLDATIVNVSVPAMMNDFHAPVSQVQWVVSVYMIAFAVLMPLTGWLREQLGSRKLYLLALGVFTVGSLACGLAWNLGSLVAFRVVQALGGGAMTPIAMAILTETFPANEKGRALGVWGAGVLLGPILGPPLGGFLTEWAGWRSIFLVNLPIGVLGVAAAAVILRRDKPAEKIRWSTFDFKGFGLLSGFLISLLYGASVVEQDGFQSPTVALYAAAAIVFLITFLVSELRSRHQVLDFSLFRSRTFGLAIVIGLVRSFALYGGQFLLPLFLARVQGYTEDRIGLMILPGAVVIGALLPFSGRASDRYGSRPFILAGLLVLVGYFVSMTRIDVDTSTSGILIPVLVRGFGLGLLVTPLTSMALGAIPVHKSANGSILLNLTQQLGGSLGIASLGSVLEYQTRAYSRTGAGELVAAVSSYQDAYRFGAVICAIAFLVALGIPKPIQGKGHGTA